MDALLDLSWRVDPAALMMAVGFILAIRGTLYFLRGFRRAVIGFAIAGIAAAWLWQIDWILVLSLVIGGEELLESTLHIQALGMAGRNERRLSRKTQTQSRKATPLLDGGGLGLAAEPVWLGPRRRDGGISRRF
jgi:hypothetical protein